MMSDVRKGVTQAQFNTSNAYVIVFEVFIAAMVIGFLSHSFLVFFMCLFAIPFLLFMPKIGGILTFIFCSFWALLAGDFGYLIGGGDFSSSGSHVWAWVGRIFFGLVAFIIAFVFHISGSQHFNDLS